MLELIYVLGKVGCVLFDVLVFEEYLLILIDVDLNVVLNLGDLDGVELVLLGQLLVVLQYFRDKYFSILPFG